MSGWKVLWQHRGPIDPDHGGAPAVMTLWRDNLDGLMLGMNCGDGAEVIVLPVPSDAADDLAAAVHEHRTAPSSAPAEVAPAPEPTCECPRLTWFNPGNGTFSADGRCIRCGRLRPAPSAEEATKPGGAL